MKKTKSKKPNIGFCVGFQQGYEILKFVLTQKHKINFVATCNGDDSIYRSKIEKLCLKNKIKLFQDLDGNESHFISYLNENNIDIVFLLWWPNIIKTKAINSVKMGWINLHPSLLPYGRGKHGYFWSIVENKPFGVSIHYIDDGIDTGPVLFQRKINVSFEDTGESLYSKSSKEIIKLFKESYNQIITLNFSFKKQNNKNATSHFAYEIDDKSNIDLNRKYKAMDLINLIRARTFNDGPSIKVRKDNFDYYLKLKIEKIDKKEK